MVGLILCPNDHVTKFTIKWGKEISNMFDKKTMNHILLTGSKVNRNRIRKYYLENCERKTDILVFLGHGPRNGTLMWDENEKPLMTEDDMKYFLSCISIACYTSKVLGNNAVEKYGVKAYLGFNDALYLTNKIINEMHQCIMSGIKTILIPNATFHDAYEAMHKHFKDFERKFQPISFEDAFIFGVNKNSLELIPINTDHCLVQN